MRGKGVRRTAPATRGLLIIDTNLSDDICVKYQDDIKFFALNILALNSENVLFLF